MRHAHLTHLIDQAASAIEENAEAVRADHSFAGHWVIESEADEHTKAAYERDIELITALRAAKTEFSAYHKACTSLEQLLRAHRIDRAEIRYHDLAALLPNKP